MLEKNVDNYIAGLEPWKGQIVAGFSSIMPALHFAPDEKVKFAPMF